MSPRRDSAAVPGRRGFPRGRGLPRRRGGPLVAGLLGVGGLVYASWVLQGWVAPDGLDPVRTYASELSATDQATSWFFRSADVLAGLLVGAAAALALRARPGARLGWCALVVFAAATVADAAFPLSCAPSADAACAAREAARQVPLGHEIHLVTSVVAGAALLVAVVALTASLRAGGGPLATLGVLAGAGYLLGTALTLAEAGRAFVDWPWPAALGVAQRGQLLCASAWLVALAGCWARGLDRSPGVRTPPSALPERG